MHTDGYPGTPEFPHPQGHLYMLLSRSRSNLLNCAVRPIEYQLPDERTCACRTMKPNTRAYRVALRLFQVI
jgi:hypothetical protein